MKSIPDNDDSSVDDLLSTSKPFSKTTVKVDDSIDELLAGSNPFLKKTPRNDDLPEISEDKKEPKMKSTSQSPRNSKSATPIPTSARSNEAISNPETGNSDQSRRSSLKVTQKSLVDVPVPVPAPRSRGSSVAPDNLEKEEPKASSK